MIHAYIKVERMHGKASPIAHTSPSSNAEPREQSDVRAGPGHAETSRVPAGETREEGRQIERENEKRDQEKQRNFGTKVGGIGNGREHGKNVGESKANERRDYGKTSTDNENERESGKKFGDDEGNEGENGRKVGGRLSLNDRGGGSERLEQLCVRQWGRDEGNVQACVAHWQQQFEIK
jgi:hypothetical protein